MLRRIVLTATVTALSAAALGATATTAGASGLPVPLPLLSPAPDRLTVVVSETGNTRTDGRYELECAPPRGTHPAAEGACERLDQLARQGKNPFKPVGKDQMCTQQAGGPAKARITGTWQGRRINATFTRTNGCEISRWNSLHPVLPSARS
ncbi:SSI family serine proteinase inhibitor [Streptomyces sp. NPDC051018]|uniref:SSI family serine proteinase inhibitor n=1 Tax=Streptomyces sp. NPDC051018 TaxID=3365639 RepID=UPI003795C748